VDSLDFYHVGRTPIHRNRSRRREDERKLLSSAGSCGYFADLVHSKAIGNGLQRERVVRTKLQPAKRIHFRTIEQRSRQ